MLLIELAINSILSDPISDASLSLQRKEQLLDNIAATEVELSESEMQELDEISELSPEYPGWMIRRQQDERWPEE